MQQKVNNTFFIIKLLFQECQFCLLYLLTYTQVILAFSRQTFISQVTVSFCQYLLQIIDCCARKSSIKSN